MPRTSEERRYRWRDDAEAVEYLKSQGWTLLKSFCWQLPTPDHLLSYREGDAMVYLIEEWDYGNIQDRRQAIDKVDFPRRETSHTDVDTATDEDKDTDTMGAFSGMKNAKRGFASNPLQSPGRYLVRIDECAFFEYTDNKGSENEMWKTTVTVLAVQEGGSKEGEQCHIFYKLGGNVPKQTFQANLKGFICSVLNVEEDEVGEAETLQCLDAKESPLNGLVTMVTARNRKSKKTKNEETGDPVEFAVYSFSEALKDSEIKEVLEPTEIKKYFPNGLPGWGK